MTVITRTSRFFTNQSLGLVLVRLALGLVFFTHGLMKIQYIPKVMVMMAHFGFAPGVAYFIAWLEVIGGIALILGIATRFFAFLFGIEMLVATILIGFAQGLGFEFTLSIVSFGLALTGSGSYSLYSMDYVNRDGVVTDHVDQIVQED
jgi:putative oxidoreductase